MSVLGVLPVAVRANDGCRVILNLTYAERTKAPSVAVISIGTNPLVAGVSAVVVNEIVDELNSSTEVGDIFAVTPAGSPDTESTADAGYTVFDDRNTWVVPV